MLTRQPTPDIFKCSNCGADVEIWSDEAVRRCQSCHKDVYRVSMEGSCLDWCHLAKECVGEVKYNQYGEMKAVLRKQTLLQAMEDYFGQDIKRIRHAKTVVSYAERILPETTGANPNVVIAAAVLHDIGIKNAETTHGSSAAQFQELEGPPVARDILVKLGYDEPFIAEVCDIVGHHHHPATEETVNFDVLYDSDLLTNIQESGKHEDTSSSGTGKSMAGTFRTEAGKRIADSDTARH
jgi:HD superfamily phosphodiesterase